MVASAVQGFPSVQNCRSLGSIKSFKTKSFKTGHPGHARQPFCSQMEEQLLLYLQYCGETLKLPDSYVRILLQGGVHEDQYAYARADHQDH